MLNLEAIKQRHLRKEQMEHRTFYEGHIVIDLAALVEEVEHLRGERAAVVAFLREVADAPETYVDEAIALRGASFAIERGEHRREEEP
jgi:hypothetical protein